jgi:hypothetical protein
MRSLRFGREKHQDRLRIGVNQALTKTLGKKASPHGEHPHFFGNACGT